MEPVPPAAAARLLGVPADAGAPAVEAAFRRLARSRHPDRGGDPAAFRRLVAARVVLLGTAGAAATPPLGATPPVVVRRSQRHRDELRASLERRLGRRPPRVR
ncbi:MAG: hypothetical protein WKF93_03240 [Acidimicrobiales bacterium]